VVERDPRDACAALVGDELEVVGLAADDAAQRHQRVEVVALGQGVQRQRHLQRAGHGDVAMSRSWTPRRFQLLEAALRQLVRERGIEARLHDADAQVAPVEFSALSPLSASCMVGFRFEGHSLADTKPVTSRP
jgi:hypothetical protein